VTGEASGESASADDLLERARRIVVWKQGERRAPHKPLLLLMALGRLARGDDRLGFAECEGELRDLIRDFGPGHTRRQPELPFHHLQSDGLWTIVAEGEHVNPSGGPSARLLRDREAYGWFPAADARRLRSEPGLLEKIVRAVLDNHFPESLHADILDRVSLDLGRETVVRRRRDPRFRERVLTAYQHRCSVCGLDVRINGNSVGLEAAHIKWHQAGGPDVEGNGLALCALHHKLFDLGAFTLLEDRRVVVSERAHGGPQFETVLLRHHGRPLATPTREAYAPALDHARWHRDNVFKQDMRRVEVG